MTIEGRIGIDVLFHDKDGTNAVNVLSLDDSTQYAAGKAAMISRTVTSGTISLDWSTWRDSQGNATSIGNPTRLAFRHSGYGIVTQTGDNGERETRFVSTPNEAVVIPVNPALSIEVQTLGGPATLTAIIYGDA